ncbi:MAG: hypothetical protein AAFQ58_22010 [Pseudomonadota bacterium]
MVTRSLLGIFTLLADRHQRGNGDGTDNGTNGTEQGGAERFAGLSDEAQTMNPIFLFLLGLGGAFGMGGGSKAAANDVAVPDGVPDTPAPDTGGTDDPPDTVIDTGSDDTPVPDDTPAPDPDDGTDVPAPETDETDDTPDPDPGPDDVPDDTPAPVPDDGTDVPAPDTGGTDDTPDTGTDTGTDDTTPPDTGSDTTPATPPVSGEPIALGDGSAAVTVTGGRVSTLAAEDHATAQSIRILEDPEHGNLTVNPDNTLALVMTTSDFTGSMNFRYEVTDADGNVQQYDQTLTVEAGTQQAGWGQGHHYLLETDENDDTIVETGDDHRKVFVSNSEDALSRADIAALEGLDESEITGRWLAENGMYGADEEMALKPDAGMDLWYTVTGERVAPNSNWLLFEKGYTYDDLGRVVTRGLQGEDELHPVHITSWGEGEQPIIASQIVIFQRDSDDVVFSDLQIDGGVAGLLGTDFIFENITATQKGWGLQNLESMTIRNSTFRDIHKEDPFNGSDWQPHADRDVGIYSANSNGLLIENTLFAQIGWEEGYDPNGDGDLPQPPSQFTQNVYVADSGLDFTFRDNVSTKAASYGLQARGGGLVEDNLFAENNAALFLAGGSHSSGEHAGNYSLVNGNVITSAAYKGANLIGALSRGLHDISMDSTLLDNIVAHLADPNDPDDIAAKEFNNGGLILENSVTFDNTIVYNWEGTRASSFDLEQNIDGLDTDVLDATTYNTLAQSVLNDPNATADDLAEYLKTNDFNTDELLAFFKDAFEVVVAETAAGTTHTFVPNALGGGIRWDNRINWDNNTLPQNGDSVDLNGNWVHFAANVDLQDITFGDGADLKVTAGRLDIEDTTTVGDGTATLHIDDAGQFWTNGVAAGDDLDVDVDGGRFANTGEISGGVSFDITDGQVLLATDGAALTLEAGDVLEITGTQAKVGFDGEDRLTAGLYLKEGATLSFVADDQGLETIEEFRSGGLGDTPEVYSKVDLGQSGLQIDVTEIAGDISDSLLIDVDELLGTFDTIALIGLGDQQDAEVMIDYESDTVSLRLFADGEGTGETFLTTVGDTLTPAIARPLWDVLTDGHGTFEEADEEPELQEPLLLM